jgi:hypothetical protein
MYGDRRVAQGDVVLVKMDDGTMTPGMVADVTNDEPSVKLVDGTLFCPLGYHDTKTEDDLASVPDGFWCFRSNV